MQTKPPRDQQDEFRIPNMFWCLCLVFRQTAFYMNTAAFTLQRSAEVAHFDGISVSDLVSMNPPAMFVVTEPNLDLFLTLTES